MKKCYFKKWSYALAFMGLLLLMSGTSWAETPQYLKVSGITNPATANGIYVKQVGTTGLSPNWESWKHESQNYFIYADEYSGENFWNIDNNLNDDDDAFFYSDGEHDARFISNLKSPDLVWNWSPGGFGASEAFDDGSGTGGVQVDIYTPSTVATLTTSSATTISTTSATLGGNITADGGSTVTGRGVVYSSTDATPTIGEAGVTQDANGSGIGSFSKSIGSLIPNTTYYVRAYATNTAGTNYGGVVSFTTDAIPAVTSVAVPANATYVASQNLDFTVNFNKAITVVTTGGTPYIPITLATGGTVNAAYVSGSNTSALTFRYTVISGNNDADGIAVGSAITANGGTLKDASGNNATLTLNSVGSTTGVKVDAIAPTVTTVSASTANGSYKIGDVIAITVQFSESMMVTGTSTLALATGGTASYSSGSGSSTLTFNYTVGTGHVSADLDYTNTSSLSLSGGTIKDVAGNNAILTLASPGATNSLGANKAIVIDGVVPTVTITSTSAAITYTNPIPVTVTFSESVTGFTSDDVTVNGTVNTFTGSGASYTFTVTPAGQGLVTVAIAAGVAQDAAGNLSTAATSLNRTFDNVAPTVSITSTAFSTTNVSPIPVTITFSEPVTGFAVNDLSLINCTASGFTGSGTTYTVNIIPSGQVTVTVYVGVNVAADGAGNTNTVTAQLNRTFDTVAPDVSITSASASVTNVSPIPVTITFNEPVNYFDVSDLSLTNCTASDFNGSGSTYTVKIIPSGQGAVVVNVAAGVATDGMGHPNTAATQLSRTFDNVAPVISGVSNNGTYNSAQSPTFNEGTATLIKNGGTAAAYLSGTAINATGSYVLTATDAAGNVATASFTITQSTGIDDESKPSLAVYPNPCTDGFKISGIDAPANVIITDLTGRVVVTTMVEVDGDVPVGHLKQGTYLVKVNERVLKLIKK